MLTTDNKKKKLDVNMTEGSIVGHLVRFAIPVCLGSMFQLLYNLVDTWVVGNYVSTAAYSAVGNLGSVMNIFIGLFMGFSSGAGVVISHFFGSQDDNRVRDSVHTVMVLTIVLSLLFTVAGLLLAPVILGFLNMPDDVYQESMVYFKIWVSGISGLLIYNVGSGIMRAVGDSKRPFYFQIVAAILNVVLDLMFVIKFNMGVAGVAYATIISQFVSAVLTIASLATSDSAVKLSFRYLKVDIAITKKILKLGVPSSFQTSITAFSNVFLQSYINEFGKEVMGGWTSYSKLDQFITLSMSAIGIAVTTFVGQNCGKGDIKRARRGTVVGVILTSGVVLVTSFILYVFADELVYVLNKDSVVIDYGVKFIRALLPFFLFWGISDVISRALIGNGQSFIVMALSLFSFVAFRQVYLFILTHFFVNRIELVALAYPLGWIIALILKSIAYKFYGPGAKGRKEKAA